MAIKISATKNEENFINKDSNGLFLGVVFVGLLISIFALSLWMYEASKTAGKINSKVELRLSILEEQLKLADSTSTEFLSDLTFGRDGPSTWSILFSPSSDAELGYYSIRFDVIDLDDNSTGWPENINNHNIY